MRAFTPATLPTAIASLFKLNHYEVQGPVKVNGAEIDLVATPLGNPFAGRVYIEATVEYVNNAKYGKDLTKLVMVRESEPSATCLIVSSTGFTADVRERAKETRIETFTYQELFARFEKFQPYVELMTGDSEQATSLSQLASVYERPNFEDSHGKHDAVTWMNDWLNDPDLSKSWLIILGEYGTGKSALTRMLQKYWLESYQSDPEAAIPVRIELGNFTKQFDAQGLLHHFLDHNRLGHVPIEFFWTLIRSRRVVLILDGYDEMAQYLTQRERRSTLHALAELSAGGARGLLTSRPNHLSETEELALFEHLYREISIRSQYVKAVGEEISARESQVDQLIQRSILDRYERSMRDLTPDQARRLVRSTLRDSPENAETVVSVLDKVFRSTDEGTEISLSGKPVIISYLIEVATSLPRETTEKLSEWDVYTLIVDHLAIRDLEQTARVTVGERRMFLQELAHAVAKSGEMLVSEDRFRALVERSFQPQLRRFSGAGRAGELEVLFEDLRRSGTLTTVSTGVESGWKFSHNSLREFLAAERMIDDLVGERLLVADLPVTDAMRAFVVSRGAPTNAMVAHLASAWRDVASNPSVGTYATLLWDALEPTESGGPIQQIAGSPASAIGVHMGSVDVVRGVVNRALIGSSFRNCTLIDVSFASAMLSDSKFNGSLFENVDFDDADLSNADFSDTLLSEVSMVGAVLSGARFIGVGDDTALIIDGPEGRVRVEGPAALGYLAFCGAEVDAVDEYYKWIYHPRFDIVDKVSRKLIEGGQRQRRGLVQRGAANVDPGFARRYVQRVESLGWAKVPLGRPELLEITPAGRAALGGIRPAGKVPPEVIRFLEDEH